MAAGVVDDLELVEVEAAQRIGGLARLGALQRPLHPALELAPVDETGQHVVTGVIGQAPVQLARLADVVEDEHAAGYGAAAVTDRGGCAVYVEFVAVAADQQHRSDRLDRAGAADRHRQRVLERLAGFLMEAAEHLLDRAPLAVLEPPAGQRLGDRVDVVDDAAGIGRDDAVADALQRDLRAFLLAEQRLLVELAVSDVELDADQAQEPPLVVDPGLGAADDPAPFAGGVAHAVHALEEGGLAGNMVADRRLHPRHVVRVDQQTPVGRVPHLFLVVA